MVLYDDDKEFAVNQMDQPTLSLIVLIYVQTRKMLLYSAPPVVKEATTTTTCKVICVLNV